MRDQNLMMIDRQAEIITDLRNQLKQQVTRVAQLENEVSALAPAAKFYTDLQEQVQKNPLLLSEWRRFCSFLKIGADEEYLDSVNSNED